MTLTVEELLGLLAREVQSLEENLVKGAASKNLRALHRNLLHAGILYRTVEIESEDSVKKDSDPEPDSGLTGSVPITSQDDVGEID